MTEPLLYDITAEESVLGGIMVDPDRLADVLNWLKPSHFGREKNRWIYEAMLALHKQGIPANQVLVAHEIAKDGDKLKAMGGYAYLSILIADTAPSPFVKYYGKAVLECAQTRERLTRQKSNPLLPALQPKPRTRTYNL